MLKLLSATALLGSAAAFAPTTVRTAQRSQLRSAVSDPADVAAKSAAPAAATPAAPAPAELFGSKVSTTEAAKEYPLGSRIMPGRYDDTTTSLTSALLPRPANLDGSHAGDFGFDPLGLSPTDGDLYVQMEAEIKHGRLAMLAVVGWPLAEMAGLDGLLADGGRAPSVLNGALLDSPLALATTLLFFGGVGAFEYFTALRPKAATRLGAQHATDMELVWDMGVAGDADFDPLGLYGTFGNDALGRKAMRDVEVANGRAAMVGIASFAFLEALTGAPVTETFSMFFQPNLLLPVLWAAWTFGNSVAEFSDVREYPVRLQWRAGGEETATAVFEAAGKAAAGPAAALGKLTADMPMPALKMPDMPKMPEL